MLTRQVSKPFGILCAGFVGPLPRSKEGSTALLVFFDTFTKWVELIPLRKATTATLIRALRERLIIHFGAPKNLVCDNGSQFTSKALKDFLKKTELKPQFAAPYCPRESPAEEEPTVEVGADATKCLRSPEKFTDRRTRTGMPRFLRQDATPD